jgi:hypothetical protein
VTTVPKLYSLAIKGLQKPKRRSSEVFVRNVDFLFHIHTTKNTRRLLNEVSGRHHLRHSQFCDAADGKRIQKLLTTPLSLTLVTSKDESHTTLSVSMSCGADGHIFVYVLNNAVILPCGALSGDSACLSVLQSHRLCHQHVSTYLQIRW